MTSVLILGPVVRGQAAPMTLYLWGSVRQGDVGSFEIPNRTIDVSDGFPGFSQSLIRNGELGWKPVGWSQPIEGEITIGLALYDGDQQGLAYGYLRGPIEGAFTRYSTASNIGGGAGGEAILDLNNLDYYTYDRWTGLPIPSTVDRVPSWFYGLKASLVGNITGGSQNTYESSLTIPAVLAVPEPGPVVVFLAAAGGGLLMIRRRAAF